MFNGIFDTDLTRVISVKDFLLCIGVSLLLGFIMAAAFMFKTVYTKSFVITLALLPAAICIVIMMVNGNVGTGVAVAGAFSLIRFRSVPGSAKEICAIFVAMAAGLITGMGYLAFALVFTVIMALALMFYTCIGFGNRDNNKTVTVTIPEDLDYTGVFDDIFKKYTRSSKLVYVKTTNMGSMFRLTYNICLTDCRAEKQMIDEMRLRNGNLEISVSPLSSTGYEL